MDIRSTSVLDTRRLAEKRRFEEGYKTGLNGTSIHGFHIQNFMNGYNQGVKDMEYNAKLPAGVPHIFHPFHSPGT